MKLFFRKRILNWLMIQALLCCHSFLLAQPNTTINLDNQKSKRYEDRQLRSEKTTEGNLSTIKKAYQNTVTHYNYFFNAENRYNAIIAAAKTMYKDDYSKLISFYKYSYDVTALHKNEIDSVLYKCNAGILLHDLRSDWVDDLYLLMGKTYMLRKNFDSAAWIFQYINYIYAPKDDGYDIPIGSNASNTNGEFTIASKDKRNFFQKLTVKPVTRNESFIWQTRNMIEMNRLADASSLISILKIDPNFPSNLKTDLYEQMAYLYYKLGVNDSAAKYLLKALPNAANKNEEARWEYLAAQLYAASNKNVDAVQLFEKAANHTIDPYLEVFARLNMVNLAPENNQANAINTKIAELQKMAKRDKYDHYRDIIYYANAILELKRKNDRAAMQALIKSTSSSIDNPEQKQKSFLLLGDVCYSNQLYKDAYRFYDSAKTSAALPADIASNFDQKQKWLKQIVENNNTIHLQDSLLLLASLSEPDRIAAVKAAYKQTRKAQGLKEDADASFGGYDPSTLSDNTLFNVATNKSSDFYFVNSSLKAQGFRDFKQKWGNRPNVDNWRRQAAILTSSNINSFNVMDVDAATDKQNKQDTSKALTFEGMLLNIPLTPQKKSVANNSIINALYNNGNIFQNQLEEIPAAIKCFEELLRRYPLSKFNEQSLYNLYYCYNKTAQTAKADSIKLIINEVHPDGNLTYSINNKNKDDGAATKRYEDVYNLFIEGKFEQAELAKQKADNQYGKNYWSPQLLYIEAIYYVKQRRDSVAINRLQSLLNQFPTSNLAEKSQTMIDVLRRRNEIETYLTNLDVEKKEDAAERPVTMNETKAVANAPAPKKELPKAAPTAIVAEKKVDIPPPTVKNLTDNNYVFNPVDEHFALLILNKVDEVFINEAKNAFNRFNRERYSAQSLAITSSKLTPEKTLMLIGPFPNAGDAINYIDVVKPLSKTRIISWLSADKYNYSIISNSNLTKLNNQKDTDAYSKFIKDIFPDKF